MSSYPFYATIDEVRAEGADPTLTDEFIQGRIEYASRCIDEFTGRWFYVRPGRYELDGTGTPIQPVPDPIVSISEVAIICDPSDTDPLDVLCTDEYVVYNRHLRQGLVGEPDDREAPRIEIRGYGTYEDSYSRYRRIPSSNQRVRVTGRFGYTDPVPACALSSISEPFALTDGDTLTITVDGGDPAIVTFSSGDFADITQATALEVVVVIQNALIPNLRASVSLGRVFLASQTAGAASTLELVETTVNDPVFGFPSGVIGFPEGVTPIKIRRACLLMVFRDLEPLGERGDRWYQNQGHRITKLKTRDQEIGLSANGSSGGGLTHQTTGFFTGDPEIDNIIAMYVRPPEVGFVGGVDHNTVSPYGLYPDRNTYPYGDSFGVGYPLYGFGPYTSG